MVNLRPCLLLTCLAIVGCGTDAAGPSDAAAADFAPPADVALRDLSGPIDVAGGPADLAGGRDLTSATDQSAPADLTAAADLSLPPDLTVAPDLSQIGGACACGGGQFCKFTIAFSCAGAGMCRQRPQICNLLLDPVCGCDGQDYDNECQANARGTDIAKKGKC